MFFWDVLRKPCHEIQNRDGLADQFSIFMAIVMKSNKFPIVRINAGCCNDGSAKIATDVIDYLRRFTFIGHSSNVKTIFMIMVDRRF